VTTRKLSPAEAERFDWTRSGPAARVMAALEAAKPGASRFVGGCVRDSLAGATPKDIDIATQLRPVDAGAALKAAGLGVAPTGLAHGTITAVADHVGVEVATLRADVSTDGRRATVAYTENWETDARRRDFTINALYLAPDLALFDAVGGAADLAAGRVRFIGAAKDRIREDYLRILRFFRFSARFADAFDAAGLAACAALKDGIAKLSAERVGDEMTRILSLGRAPFAVDAMARSGVLAAVWPASPDLAAFGRLKSDWADAPAPLGLAALWSAEGEGVDARLRLPNASAARRRAAVAGASRIDFSMDARAGRVVQYRIGEQAFFDGLALASACAGTARPAVLAAISRSTPPAFALSGRDVLSAGVEAGPRVAEILKVVEERWVAEDFPDETRQRALLAETIAPR
jgi:poly(A) polymerase